MKKTEKISFIAYLVLGAYIGVKAMFFYMQNVTNNVFFRGMCLILAVAIAGFVEYKLRKHRISTIILAIVAFFSIKLLAWGVVWIVCLLQAIGRVILIVLKCIVHAIKMVTS